MSIKKSEGQTKTERLLADLCARTFLALWSYPNPFKNDRKELCDLIAVFEDHVFLFFDRESRKFDSSPGDFLVAWNRWKNEAVDKQINTANGAEKYIRSGKPIFLDAKNETEFPLSIGASAKIHKFVIAHGAKDACQAYSDENVYGSLALSYHDNPTPSPFPFRVNLDRNNIVHLLDSHNLEILFGELDTFFDFVRYVNEKERAIQRYQLLTYCGEEDLLANFFLSYDEERNSYAIGPKGEEIDGLFVGEGEWKEFIEREEYKARKEANKTSYLWDEIIQRTCQHALGGTSLGNANLFTGDSAIREMAMEPRLFRRAASQRMIQAIQNFPINSGALVRQVSLMPSYYKEKAYVFLQLKCLEKGDYEANYRPKRQALLKIACGAARNKYQHLIKVIGIAIDAPKFATQNSEDFILLDCSDWPDELAEEYRNANKDFHFFETGQAQVQSISDFPARPLKIDRKQKVGRNDSCPCGSGKKYKNCCIAD